MLIVIIYIGCQLLIELLVERIFSNVPTNQDIILAFVYPVMYQHWIDCRKYKISSLTYQKTFNWYILNIHGGLQNTQTYSCEWNRQVTLWTSSIWKEIKNGKTSYMFLWWTKLCKHEVSMPRWDKVCSMNKDEMCILNSLKTESKKNDIFTIWRIRNERDRVESWDWHGISKDMPPIAKKDSYLLSHNTTKESDDLRSLFKIFMILRLTKEFCRGPP